MKPSRPSSRANGSAIERLVLHEQDPGLGHEPRVLGALQPRLRLCQGFPPGCGGVSAPVRTMPSMKPKPHPYRSRRNDASPSAPWRPSPSAPAPSEPATAVSAPKAQPVEVRTVVVHRTVHVVRARRSPRSRAAAARAGTRRARRARADRPGARRGLQQPRRPCRSPAARQPGTTHGHESGEHDGGSGETTSTSGERRGRSGDDDRAAGAAWLAQAQPRAGLRCTMAALFVGLFGLLGVRMAQGQDPALGAKKQVAVVQPHKVLVRKVVVTKQITIIKPAAAPAASGGQTLRGADAGAPAPPRRPTRRRRRRTPPPRPPHPRRLPRRSRPPPPELSRHSANPQTAALELKTMSQRSLIPVPTAAGIAPAAVDRAFPLMGTHMRVVVGAPGPRRPALAGRGRRRGRRLPRGLQRAALALSRRTPS